METIVRIKVADLHDSPTNPRSHFDEAYIAELGADIKSHGGLLQPIVVRPRVPPLFAGDPDGATGMEIVFGHCRKRGAIVAGLDEVDCIVRTMTDGQVQRAQISENLQRRNVHPIEEAQGFQALIDGHNMTADLIAAEFGKSRSYVYGRLKLLTLCPEVRKACLAGDVGTEVALLIARVGGPKLQTKALADIKGRNDSIEDGGKRSFRNIRRLLAERYTLDLKDALFDTEDEMLVPDAGHCVRCPKRSGNAPEFSDLVAGDNLDRFRSGPSGPDVCTDPDCFDAKKRAHLKREAEKLTAAGKNVVEGSKARQAIDAYGRLKSTFIPLKDVRAELKKAAGDKKPKVLTIQDPRSGKLIEAVAVAELAAAGLRQTAPTVNQNRSADTPSAQSRDHVDHGANAQAETTRRVALFKRVLEVAHERDRTESDMRLIARYMVEQLDYDAEEHLFAAYEVDDREQLEDKVAHMTAFEVGTLMLAVATSSALDVNWHNYTTPAQHLDAVVTEYGITQNDPADGASNPSSAAQAPEEDAPAGDDQSGTDVVADATAEDAPAATKKPRKSKAKAPAPLAQEQTDDAGFADAEPVLEAAWPFPRTLPTEAA